ncbi:hypothetical protein COO72_05310 [Bifidobacterium callitrichos]|nr:hypothetical protein COO72_05310 [Bifidobacterium callitrichos]
MARVNLSDRQLAALAEAYHDRVAEPALPVEQVFDLLAGNDPERRYTADMMPRQLDDMETVQACNAYFSRVPDAAETPAGRIINQLRDQAFAQATAPGTGLESLNTPGHDPSRLGSLFIGEPLVPPDMGVPNATTVECDIDWDGPYDDEDDMPYPDPTDADPYTNPVDHAPDPTTGSVVQPSPAPSGPSLS